MENNDVGRGICDVVKFEVSSDNGDEPVVLSETTQLSPMEEIASLTDVADNGSHSHSSHFIGQNSTGAIPSSQQTSSLSSSSESSSSTTIKTIVPTQNSELIRLFGPTTSQPVDIDGNPILQAGSLASQFCPLGPKERCTPSQAQAMGEQILGLMAMHENNGTPLPFELQNTFDIFHRCLAVAYGTFFLNLYTKANAPCVLCHGCKSLYPPGQYIHHSCLALPPNIVPCRSRMWRRCLVPLMSQDMNKTDQKERWKFVLEKFSHASMGVGKRNTAHSGGEPRLLEMPECKRGKFVNEPVDKPKNKQSKTGKTATDDGGFVNANSSHEMTTVNAESPTPVDENNTTMFTCVSDEEQGGDVPFNENYEGSSRAIGIIKDLIEEVGKLERELTEAKEKLKRTEEQLKSVTSGDSLSEQFVQALLTQEKISAEKKELVKKLQAEEEKSSRLEKQLERIQLLHLEMQNQFKS